MSLIPTFPTPDLGKTRLKLVEPKMFIVPETEKALKIPPYLIDQMTFDKGVSTTVLLI